MMGSSQHCLRVPVLAVLMAMLGATAWAHAPVYQITLSIEPGAILSTEHATVTATVTEDGVPLESDLVGFEVVTVNGGTVYPETDTTDSEGKATTEFTPGSVTGSVQIRASDAHTQTYGYIYVLEETDVDLPTSNLNNAAGPDRCNFRWSGWDSSLDPNICVGDTVTVGTAGTWWHVSRVVFWVVPDVPVSPQYELGDHFSSVSLYCYAGASYVVRSTGTLSVGSSETSNPDIHISRVQYDGQRDYQASDGTYCQIWRIEFSNLSMVSMTGGTPAFFGIYGAPRYDRFMFAHATSRAEGGFGLLDTTNPTSTTPVSGENWFDGKKSDVDIQLAVVQIN